MIMTVGEKLKALLEKGARNSASDARNIQNIHDMSSALGATCSMNESKRPLTEASTWSLNDRATALQSDLAEQIPNARMCDVFPDENLVVYTIGWYNQQYYQLSYTQDDTGVATFGTPVEVNRKCTYVPTSDTTPAMESADIEISGDTIQLVEKAVNKDGITMLKLISPGIGSSGKYSEETLKQAAKDRVFAKGLHNLIDHPTKAEESARPEGSIANLGSTLVEDATWKDDYNGHGPGLYARAKVVPTFTETLNTVASDIGVSIRASGKAHIETIEGASIPVIDRIEKAKSVDYVTLPGRGGKVLELVESRRTASTSSGANNMEITQEQYNELLESIKQLRESNQQSATQVAALREGQALIAAQRLVSDALAAYPTLPRATKERLARDLPAQFRLTESGVLDATAMQETIKNAVSDAAQYLTSLGVGTGNLADLGGVSSSSASIEDLEKQISESLAAL